jgi:hypothetical protein
MDTREEGSWVLAKVSVETMVTRRDQSTLWIEMGFASRSLNAVVGGGEKVGITKQRERERERKRERERE